MSIYNPINTSVCRCGHGRKKKSTKSTERDGKNNIHKKKNNHNKKINIYILYI